MRSRFLYNFFKVNVMNRIKELRIEKGLTQAELAKELAVGRASVSNYEIELRQLDPAMIGKLCAYFHVTSDYLLGMSSQRTAKISDADVALVDAYHAAPDSIRTAIDALLQPYQEEKENTAAG